MSTTPPPLSFDRANSADNGAAFAQALSFGTIAAIVGGILFATLSISTHVVLGYEAVGIAFAIGWAMKKGSNGRGGLRYQIAAAVLLYLSWDLSFLLQILWEWKDVEGFGGGVRWPYTLGVSLISPFYDFVNGVGWAAVNLFILVLAMRYIWQLTQGTE